MTISFPHSDDLGYIHRVRNFAEDLYRQIELTGMGSVRDIDRATDSISVEVRSSRHLGAARAIIKKETQRHQFEADAVVTRL